LKVLGFLFGLVLLGLLSTVVTMQVLTWGRTVVVPNLVGKDMVTAISLAEQAGLHVKVRGEVQDPLVGKDQVARQDPPEGTRVKEGQSIGVFVNRDRKDLGVPTVEGETLRKAEVVLRQQGLRVGEVSRVHSEKAGKEFVLAQHPPPHTLLGRGEKVDLLVSLGPRAIWLRMPEVVGKRLEEAVWQMELLGLEAARPRGAGEHWVVIEQKPKAGQPVMQGGSVELTASPKKPPAPVPPAITPREGIEPKIKSVPPPARPAAPAPQTPMSEEGEEP
jgi:serine/threonine-protein kinase